MRNRRFRTIMLGLLFINVSAAADESGSSGRELYVRYGCYQCHGYEGQGSVFSGPRLAPDPLPWEAFERITRHPYGEMPAYSPRVLEESILRQIHDYLESIPAPQAE